MLIFSFSVIFLLKSLNPTSTLLYFMLSCVLTLSLMYNPREIFHFTQSDDVFGLLVAVTARWSQSNEESQNKGDLKCHP